MADMTPKQKRIIEKDVETLFSAAAFLSNPTIEDIKRLGAFHPTVKYNRGIVFLSEKGTAALRRVTDLISGLPALSECVSEREIDAEVVRSYNDWIDKLLQPTGQEFVDAVVDALLATVKEYEFLIQIEGIDLRDQDVLALGPVRIQRSSRTLLDNLKFGGNLDVDSTYDLFKDSLWLIATSRGSADIATEQFEHRATLTVGILAVCGALLYKGAIWRSRVRAFISPLQHRSPVSALRWEAGGDNPTLSRNWGGDQDLLLSSESVAYLTRECFLKRLASLQEPPKRSELEDAIVRSLYWFADAYKDRNPTMQFVKLWSCAECFFAIEKEGVTELNANGIAVILTFGGFKISEVKDYRQLKRRIKNLYDLRSEAIHRAKFGHMACTPKTPPK